MNTEILIASGFTLAMTFVIKAEWAMCLRKATLPMAFSSAFLVGKLERTLIEP